MIQLFSSSDPEAVILVDVLNAFDSESSGSIAPAIFRDYVNHFLPSLSILTQGRIQTIKKGGSIFGIATSAEL